MTFSARVVALVAALLVLTLGLGACGDGEGDESNEEASTPTSMAEIELSSTGPFDGEEEFAAAADDLCEQADAVFARSPVLANWPAGLVLELERLIADTRTLEEKYAELEPPESLAAAYEDYLAAGEERLVALEKALKFAEDDDLDGAFSVFDGELAKIGEERDALAEELGFECVLQSELDLVDEDDIAEPTDVAAEAPQPSNTIEEAYDDYFAALESGDCKQIVEVIHTQTFFDPKACDPAVNDPFLEDQTGLLATQQYGPVGVAVVGFGDDLVPTYNVFVLDPDQEDRLLYTSGFPVSGGGLAPPNEGIDADETVEAAVQAIRDNDPEALNETLSADVPPGEDEPTPNSFVKDGPFDVLAESDPIYGERIVTDIRADEDAAPELLGVDQTSAYYLLDTDGSDYLLIADHQPGSDTDYQFSAYWGLTSVEADADEPADSSAG